jgi:hypothetical protein
MLARPRLTSPGLPAQHLIDALRSFCYFDGTNTIRPTLVLLAWIAIGAALITAAALLERARQRQATAVPAVGPAWTDLAGAEGRAVRELPGPVDGTLCADRRRVMI